MATVDFKIKNVKAADSTKATLAEIAGSIDATSIVQFQTVMDKLVEKGVKNLILDCANVKYINSTGLGTLLKYADQFESMDGQIAFTRVPSKVMLVMEMLGFNALFTIVPDEATALRIFAGKPAAPPAAAPAAAPMQPVISRPGQGAAPAITRPVGAGGGTPTIVIPARGGPARAPAAPAAPAPARAAGYPTAVECFRCRLTLDVSAAGKYRCPRCSSVLVAEPSGKVKFFAPKESRPVSVTLPARPELVEGLGKLAVGVARQAGFNGTEADRVAGAIVAASSGVMEIAYGGDATGLIHLLMASDGSSLTVRISDFGEPIPAEGGVPTDERFAAATEIMDSVEVKRNPKRGNLITLTRSVD
jgi:anti-sigma B factor antagonist